MAKNKNVTIDDLAVMVQRGFNETAKSFNETAKKSDMDFRFNEVDKRLDKIEKLILADHKKRIEHLEAEVKELRELFAM